MPRTLNTEVWSGGWWRPKGSVSHEINNHFRVLSAYGEDYRSQPKFLDIITPWSEKFAKRKWSKAKLNAWRAVSMPSSRSIHKAAQAIEASGITGSIGTSALLRKVSSRRFDINEERQVSTIGQRANSGYELDLTTFLWLVCSDPGSFLSEQGDWSAYSRRAKDNKKFYAPTSFTQAVTPLFLLWGSDELLTYQYYGYDVGDDDTVEDVLGVLQIPLRKSRFAAAPLGFNYHLGNARDWESFGATGVEAIFWQRYATFLNDRAEVFKLVASGAVGWKSVCNAFHQNVAPTIDGAKMIGQGVGLDIVLASGQARPYED